jgi:hypothetical protein
MGCSARIRSTEEGEIGLASPAFVISAASSGPLQRASGTPVAVGSGQASATTRGPLQRGDPPWPPGPGQLLEPVEPAGGEPDPPLADRVHTDVQVCRDPGAGPVTAAASTICARSQSR